MNNTIAFDTLAYAKRLIAAGMPAKQAEVQTEIFAEIIDENIATKRDLKEQETKLIFEINRTKLDIIKWVGRMLIAQAIIVATLVKLF